MFPALPLPGPFTRVERPAHTEQFGKPNELEWARNKLKQQAKAAARALRESEDSRADLLIVRFNGLTLVPFLKRSVAMWYFHMDEFPMYVDKDGTIYRRLIHEYFDFCLPLRLEKENDLRFLSTLEINLEITERSYATT